jgi:hypothetical protein
MKVKTTMWRVIAIAPGMLVAASLIASACRDATAPERVVPVGGPSFSISPAEFRLTGGGRVDEEDHVGDVGNAKNTPGSRDFATFGFQARPVGTNTNTFEGSGNITWVEHNPDETFGGGGGFTFHGRVDHFAATPADPEDPDEICARFWGTGRVRTRSGMTDENATFTVLHGCDGGEPGVGEDHIWIIIHASFGTATSQEYSRHGLLSGGNIQAHAL